MSCPSSRRGWRVSALFVAPWLITAIAGCGGEPQSLLARPYTAAHAEFMAATAGEDAGIPCLAGARRTVSPPGRSGPRALAAAAAIERERRERPGAETLAAAGVVAFSSGSGWKAFELFTAAAEESPDDPRLWNDLAAAGLLRARETGEVILLVDALEAAARSAEAVPEAPEPVCNRSLALERLYLLEEARASWEKCRELSFGILRADAEAAGRRLAAPSVSERWLGARRRLRTADAAVVARIVALDPQAAREEVLLHLLPEWGEAWLAGDEVRSGEALRSSRAVGEVLVARGGDATALDAARAIERAAASSSILEALARGHLAYRRGFSLLRPSYRARAARTPLLEARRLLRPAGDPVALWAEKWLAVENLFDDRFSELTERFGRLLAAADARRYPALAGRLHWGLGMTRARQGDWMEALYHYREAHDRFTTAGEQENLGAVENLIGEAEGLLGRDPEAWSARRRAGAILSGFPESRYLHNLLWQSAEASRAAGRLRSALYFNDEGVRVARRTGDPLIESEALLRKSRTLLELDRPRAALEGLNGARAAARAVEHPPLRERLEARCAALSGEARRRLEPLAALAELDRAVAFYRDRGLEIELARVYLARARTLRELDRFERAEADLSAAIQSLERQRRGLESVQLGRSFLEASQEVFDELIGLQVEELRQPDAALVTVERARAAVAGSAAESRIERLSARLGENLEILEYALVGDHLYRWRVTRDGLDFARRVEPSGKLEELVEAFLGDLRSPRSPAAAEGAAGELARLLLPADIGARHLVVVPDKLLGRIPFAALPDPGTGRYLVEDRAVVMAPAATAYLAARERARERGRGAVRRALVVGDPAFDRLRFPHLAELVGARTEAAAVGALYAGSALIEGADATGRALLGALPGSEVLHFAGHAVGADGDPAAARLVMASGADGSPTLLGAAELEGADLAKLRLVVLSACETAAAPGRRTELLSGLAGMFLDARVPSVVGTLWPVSDQAARELVVAFHRAYSLTGNPPEALAEAQRTLIHHPDPRLRSPSGWAAFIAVGADTPRRKP